jgi:amidase
LSAASLGSDLVGSVRIPAHFCGVAGLRPTAGRVPASGHMPPVEGPFALGASLGPLARRVEDLDLMFGALSGVARGPSADEDRKRPLHGLRVAWYADDGVLPVTPETRRAVETAARILEDAGAALFEARPPHLSRATELWSGLFAEATNEFLRRTFAGREQEAGPVARLLLERSEGSRSPALAEFFAAWAERDRLRADLLTWMENAPLLVGPVGTTAAVPHGTNKVSHEGARPFNLFRAFGGAQFCNVFDLPAVTVRAGWTAEGLPVGVQLAARPRAEGLALAAARAVEEASGGWAAPRG